jgi:hypothetical protein
VKRLNEFAGWLRRLSQSVAVAVSSAFHRFLALLGFMSLGMAVAILSEVYSPYTAKWLFPGKAPEPAHAAAWIAIAGLFFTLRQQLADAAEKKSKFYFDECKRGFDTAYEVLASATPGHPETRLKWVAAARVLESARRLSSRVTSRPQRVALMMDIPYQAIRFNEFFENSGPYYYGSHPELVTGFGDDPLDRAGRISTAPMGTTMSTLRAVPETAIHTVWAAIQYPSDYQDVLGEKFSEKNRLFLPQGLREYLNHVAQWHSVGGVLHERRQ